MDYFSVLEQYEEVQCAVQKMSLSLQTLRPWHYLPPLFLFKVREWEPLACLWKVCKQWSVSCFNIRRGKEIRINPSNSTDADERKSFIHFGIEEEIFWLFREMNFLTMRIDPFEMKRYTPNHKISTATFNSQYVFLLTTEGRILTMQKNTGVTKRARFVAPNDCGPWYLACHETLLLCVSCTHLYLMPVENVRGGFVLNHPFSPKKIVSVTSNATDFFIYNGNRSLVFVNTTRKVRSKQLNLKEKNIPLSFLEHLGQIHDFAANDKTLVWLGSKGWLMSDITATQLLHRQTCSILTNLSLVTFERGKTNSFWIYSSSITVFEVGFQACVVSNYFWQTENVCRRCDLLLPAYPRLCWESGLCVYCQSSSIVSLHDFRERLSKELVPLLEKETRLKLQLDVEKEKKRSFTFFSVSPLESGGIFY